MDPREQYQQPPYQRQPQGDPYQQPPYQPPQGGPYQPPPSQPPPPYQPPPYQPPPSQPPYQPPQGQPYQQPYQPTPAGSARWGTSSVGNLGADIMSGLAYLIVLIPFVGFILQIVLFAVEKNRFAKFHAAQAMILSIAWYVLGIVSAIMSSIFSAGANATNSSAVSFVSGGIGLLFSCVGAIIGLGLFILWIWGMVAGFTGKPTKLPVAGDFAERLAGGPLGP
ncbi:MAG TPA: DUF4870 domain-containing protein [Ktedonobacterales bacterium]|nr:DUF4870 domain-containing protein [Ktedonobacterales bacterium]